MLDVFSYEGIRFVVLHGAAAIESGTAASDVDIAVGVAPRDVITCASGALADRGLFPIVRWEYDAGGATTTFVATEDGGDGVQLDLLFDPTGIGHDGIITGAVVDAACTSGRWPRLSEVHELLYLISKRQRKGDTAALAPLVAAAHELDPDVLAVEAMRIFRADVARHVLYVVGDPVARTSRGRRTVPLGPRVRRTADRMRHPVGSWVDVTGPDGAAMASALAARFGRFLPHAASGARPAGRGAESAWLARDVAPVRWRPGIYVSWAPTSATRPARLRPDVCIETPISVESAGALVVQALAARVRC